jgi:hypothetical protein
VCQSFLSNELSHPAAQIDPTSALILWQIAFTGNLGFYQEGGHLRGLRVLTEVLETHYGADHEVIVYEAAVYYPVCEPVMQRIPLFKLSETPVTLVSTLYVPPLAPAPVDGEMMARLGLSFAEEMIGEKAI